MKINPGSKEWDERMKQIREEADLSISAGTARNPIRPSATNQLDNLTLSSNEIATIQKLVAKYGKDNLIHRIERFE